MWVIKKQYTIWYEVRYANRGGLFHEDSIDRSIFIMGKLTDNEIEELVNGIRDGMGDLIKEEAKLKKGKIPMKFDVEIEMDDDSIPFVKGETDTSAAQRRCYKICVSYGGSTRCYTVCR